LPGGVTGAALLSRKKALALRVPSLCTTCCSDLRCMVK
jgi:hypothetical protein